MATFFRDFSLEALGAPANVSTPWDDLATLAIESDGTKNVLHANSGSALNCAISFTNWVSGLSGQEIALIFTTGSAATLDFSATLGQGGTASTRESLRARNSYSQSGVLLAQYHNNSYSALSSVVSKSFSANTLYGLRLRVESDKTAKLRLWDADAGDEPTSWDIEWATPVTVADGLPGIMLAKAYQDIYVERVGFATAGDTAPLEADLSPTAAFIDDAPAYNLVDNEQSITFADASNGGTVPYTYVWEYSTDGGNNWTTFSTAQAANLTPTSPGTLDVRLTVTDALDASDTSDVSSYVVGDSTHTYIREPDDRGQLAPEDCAITGGDTLTPTVGVVPRPTNVSGVEYSRYINGVVYNCAGKTPTFVVDWSTYDGGGVPGAAFGYVTAEDVVSGGYSPVWTTTPHDPDSWATFPSVTGDNTAKTITATGVTFGAGEDTIYVAYQPLMTYTANRLKVEALATNQLVSVPDSVVDHVAKPFVFATLPALESFGIPALDQRCFAIGSGPIKVAVTDSQHSNEDVGDHTFWSFVEHLLGSSPEAVAVREHFTVYCYTMVNPRGRYGGIFRQAPYSGGTLDPNRQWDGSALDCVNTVKAAIVTDLGSTFDGYIDFHGYSGSGTGLYVNESDNAYQAFPACNDDFADAMEALVSLSFRSGTDATPILGISRNYYHITGGCQFAFTLESGVWHNTVSWHDPWAHAMVSSLETMYQAGNLEIPIASLGALGLANTSSGVAVSIPAVSGGDEFRILRDGVEVRGWDASREFTDTTVADGVEYSYTYYVRNPYQVSAVSDGDTITYEYTANEAAVVYDVSVIPEGVNFSDQLDSSIVISESINDGVYFNDSFSFGGTVIQISITEGLNIYDQPSGNLLFDLLAAEGIAVSDTPTGVYLITLDLAEGITVSDTLKAGFTFDLKVADGLTISDLVTFTRQSVGRKMYLVFSSKAAKAEFES